MKIYPSYLTIGGVIAALLCLTLVGCNMPASASGTPTLNVTQAYQTVEAKLTEAVAQTPLASNTPAPTDSGVATATPTAETVVTTSEPTATPPPVTGPGSNCAQASPGFPIDVSIPDDTELDPGETFTKTWRLENAGACTWTPAFDLVWFSGEKMGAPDSVPLGTSVEPGQTVELSVDMVAPAEAGTYQSNWKLRDEAGALFGIGPNGDLAFWVRIVVVASATQAPTSPSAEETPTASPTEVVQASGSVSLQLDEGVDLDSGEVNAGDIDLIFQSGDLGLAAAPSSGAQFGVFGGEQPSMTDCKGQSLLGAPLGIEASLPVGTYLCYRTSLALPGWAQVTAFDSQAGTLGLQFLTWQIP